MPPETPTPAERRPLGDVFKRLAADEAAVRRAHQDAKARGRDAAHIYRLGVQHAETVRALKAAGLVLEHEARRDAQES